MEELPARALLARAGLTREQLLTLGAAAGTAPTHLVQEAVRGAAALAASVVTLLRHPDVAALEADLAWLEASGARILLATDADYPPLLAHTRTAPGALYVLGSVSALGLPQLAIVGSRSPTPGGRATAREFAACCARAGLAVTSGLATGIDAAGHEGALEAGGLTVAVCGTGLERVYPADHSALAARIRAHGALVSEFAPRTALRGANFPRRNRIISGLSLGTLVVEATERSGSLITARFAAEEGREVFAVPGSIRSPLSRGCHQLIRDGATLVTSAGEALAELRIAVPQEPLTAPREAARERPVLDKEYEMLLDALGFEPATIEILAARTHLAAESVASMLLILELQGRIAALPGGCYGRAP